MADEVSWFWWAVAKLHICKKQQMLVDDGGAGDNTQPTEQLSAHPIPISSMESASSVASNVQMSGHEEKENHPPAPAHLALFTASRLGGTSGLLQSTMSARNNDNSGDTATELHRFGVKMLELAEDVAPASSDQQQPLGESSPLKEEPPTTTLGSEAGDDKKKKKKKQTDGAVEAVEENGGDTTEAADATNDMNEPLAGYDDQQTQEEDVLDQKENKTAMLDVDGEITPTQKKKHRICRVCNVMVNEGSTTHHIRTQHLKQPLYRCPLCTYSSTYNKQSVQRHIATRHGGDVGMVIDDVTKYKDEMYEWIFRCWRKVGLFLQREMTTAASQTSFSVSDTPPFDPKFSKEFQPVKYLGKGAFGMVFEARNKLDDWSYAVKRIKIKNSATANAKLREVRALSKLDHSGIVRYYSTWIESPSVDWQQAEDKKIFAECGASLPSATESEESASLLKNTGETGEEVTENTAPSGSSESSILPSSPNHDHVASAGDDDDDDEASNHALSCDDRQHMTDADDSLEIDFCKSADDAATQTAPAPATPAEYLYIQMELCQKHTLEDWLWENLTQAQRPVPHMLNWLAQMISAVEYVHDSEFIHRDLKPPNIFFALDGRLKIGDFGLATAFINSAFEKADGEAKGNHQQKRGHTVGVGTTLYMSPEQLAGRSYTYKVDVFALGLIFMEMLIPFGTKTERIHTLSNVKRDVPRDRRFPAAFAADMPRECSFVERLTDLDAVRRPTCAEILSLPLLQDYAPGGRCE